MASLCTIFSWSPSTLDSLGPTLIVASIAVGTHSLFWIQFIVCSTLRQRNMMWLYAYLVTDGLLIARFFIFYAIRLVSICLYPTARDVLCYFEASTKFYINTVQTYLLLAFNICRYLQIVSNKNIYIKRPRLIIFIHFLIYILPAINVIVQFVAQLSQIYRRRGGSCDIVYVSTIVQVFNLFVIYIIPIFSTIFILGLGIRHVSSVRGISNEQIIGIRRKRQRILLLQTIIFYSIWLVLWSPDVLAGQFINANSDPAIFTALLSIAEIALDPAIIVDVCSAWSENWRNSAELNSLVYTNVKPMGGANAGKYSKIKVNSWEGCVTQCCEFHRCNIAFWISSVCVHIECVSDELCEPINSDASDINDETFYVKIRSIESTAAAIDYEDPGRDECNETKLCAINEQCEQIAINAQLKRNVCLCDRKNGYRRINGVCRQYLLHAKPCAIYENNDDEEDNLDSNTNHGKCNKNEECLPPNDRAKHGYCQCKLGFLRTTDTGKCVMDDNQEILLKTSTIAMKTTSISSSLFDLEVNAGDDQIITLPKNQIDLYGHILYKSNKSEIDMSILNNKNLTLFWILKSSTNGAKINISNQEDLTSHTVIKQVREGIYEFELKLNNKEGNTLASDIVKVEVRPATTTPPPLVVKIPSPLTIRLPQQITKLEAHVEPSDRRVTYQWTYMNDGPTTPLLDNVDTSELSVSNLRPGNYSFQLRVVDNLGNEQIKTIQLVVTGEPIEARVTNQREVVFWPSDDVILDGTSSIIEQQTKIFWTLLSNNNKQPINEIEVVSPHSLKTRISNLHIGQYIFQLILTTNDQEYVSKKDILVIVYAQDGQPPKISINSETPNVNIINNLLILNASTTTADYGIAKWQWKKSPLSPAIGYFINNSDSSSIAYITNLIEGQYIFNLYVYDDRHQMSESNITIHVDGIPDAENLIEIVFSARPYLYEQTLDNLLAQIRVFLIDIIPNIDIIMVGMLDNNILLLKGIDSKTDMIISPKLLAIHLQKKIKSLRSASNMNILSIDTHLCLSNCSNHGKCDQKTKRCICNRYYMENWLKSFMHKEPNCDFAIHYFALLTILGSIFTIVFCWLCLCCCLRWRRRRNLLERRKRIRYQLLHENDDDDNEDDNGKYSPHSPKEKSKSKFRLLKKNKPKTSNVIISESDMSDEHGEQTLYDKPLLTAKLQMGSPNTMKNRGLKVPVQDSNGSPMLRKNGQSPPTTDNSVA
ncbi:unnamed protein product [Adineta steineri]|uniref:G-protein coupled receptors family 1 profile domain-containing protein n=1 Tax=Adineta steineri TaxID=433720 RepID=A0A813XM96_9BILA|nr:unnamed protein product [Adineta steineri]CAF3890660.1 unnamed protein product [Adineta steineri]